MSSNPKVLSETAEPVCALCGGSGFRMVTTKDSNDRVIEKATICECRIRLRGQRLFEQARIPARYEHCQLSSFVYDCSFSDPSLGVAYRVAKSFVQEYLTDKEKKGLLIEGTVGVGKTHLAVGIIRELMLEQGVPCLFYDYRELLKEIQHSYNSGVETTELGILEPVFSTEVLLLDELGGARPTSSEWIWETVQFILNTRYNAAKATILTTNYFDGPSAEFEENQRGRSMTQAERSRRGQSLGDRVGDRIRSRLHEMCRLVTMQGEDYRMKIRGARCD